MGDLACRMAELYSKTGSDASRGPRGTQRTINKQFDLWVYSTYNRNLCIGVIGASKGLPNDARTSGKLV